MAKVRVNWGSASDGQAVSLFEVLNTSHKRLYVLARDSRQAMEIAYTANHVYMPETKHALNYSRAAYELKSVPSELFEHRQALEQATSRRLEGTVHIDPEGLSIGFECLGK